MTEGRMPNQKSLNYHDERYDIKINFSQTIEIEQPQR